MSQTLKVKIHTACLKQIRERVALLQADLEELSKAAATDTKSSAGDKYETGREMMRAEMDKLARNLSESQKLQQVLESLQPEKELSQVAHGALVKTNQGYFYLAASLGKLMAAGESVFVLSMASPMGQGLSAKAAGDTATVNGRKIELVEVS